VTNAHDYITLRTTIMQKHKQ